MLAVVFVATAVVTARVFIVSGSGGAVVSSSIMGRGSSALTKTPRALQQSLSDV